MTKGWVDAQFDEGAREKHPPLERHSGDAERRDDAVDVGLEGRGAAAGERGLVPKAGGREELAEDGLLWRGGTAGGALLTVTEHGFGKRTEIEEYRVQSRGGVGIINIATTDRNGKVVGIAYVQEADEVLLITQQGMILRMQTNDVRAIGRATQGVKLIDIEGDDRVVSIAKLVERDEDDAASP